MESSIPIISFNANESEIVSQIKESNETIGFFALVDHQVPVELVTQIWEECFLFWNRAPQSILVGNVSSSPFIWLDYSPPSSQLNSKDAWIIGPTSGRQGMPWRPDTDRMKELWIKYYDHMEILLHKIMTYFALALELDRDYFSDKLRDHRSPMRTVYYPPASKGSENDNQISQNNSQDSFYERAGEHTDWGCVTILLPDKNTSGLEIKLSNDAWLTVPFIENAFIINLGDLMPRWTCNIWKATPHRVIGKQEELKRGRMTIPFFGLVNSDTLLEAIPSCLEKQKQLLQPESTFIYQPILAGEFFSEHEKYSIYNRG